MICPLRFSRKTGKTALVIRNGPRRLIAITLSQSVTSISWMASPAAIPALLPSGCAAQRVHCGLYQAVDILFF